MSSVRVGIVGRGFGRRVLAPAFEKAGAHVASVVGRHGWRRLISDPGIDVLAIAVPPSAQPGIAIAALRRGKAVFCEKSLAEDLSQARALTTAARRAHRPAVVDFEFPETRAWRAAKGFVGAGLGRLRHAAIVWQIETYANIHKTGSWKGAQARGGGTLNNFGSHLFYNVEWLLGDIVRVSASLRGRTLGDTNASMLLTLAGGATVCVALAADAFMGSGHRIEIYGDEGSLVLANPCADYMTGFTLKVAARRAPRWRTLVKGRLARRGEDGRIEPISRLAARLMDCVRTGKNAEPGLDRGLRTVELIAAARLSHRTGRSVEVSHGR